MVKKTKSTPFIIYIVCFFGVLLSEGKEKLIAGLKEKNKEYRSEIKEAEELIIKKNRLGAVKLLLKTLEKEKLNKVATLEIKKILKEINGLFLNEKVQQNYELALNLKNSDINQSNQKLEEALSWEPDNFNIISELARQKIKAKDCKNIIGVLENAAAINPWDEAINLTLGQGYFCNNEMAKLTQIILKNKDSKRKKFSSEWLQLEFLNKLKNKEINKCKELLKEFKDKDPNNLQIEVLETLLFKNKPASLACKSMSPNLLWKYQFDPYFCELEKLVELIEK